MNRFQRRAATYPGALEAARRDYELRGLGYRLLSERYGIPRTTVAYHATKGNWVKPAPPAITYARGRRRGERCRDSYFG